MLGVCRSPLGRSELGERGAVNEALPPGYFLERGNLEPLPRLNRLHEVSRAEKLFGRARIEPEHAAAEPLDRKLAGAEIGIVHVGDFQFAARRRLHVRRDIGDMLIEEIQPRDRPIGGSGRRFFDDLDRAAAAVEAYNSESLRVQDLVGEIDGAFFEPAAPFEDRPQRAPKKNIVAKDERDPMAFDEIAADDERLGDAARLVLGAIGDVETKGAAVAQQPLEWRDVGGSRDQENLPHARKHKHRDRVIDHRLVIDRQQMLVEPERHRKEPASRPPRQYNSAHQAAPFARPSRARR